MHIYVCAISLEVNRSKGPHDRDCGLPRLDSVDTLVQWIKQSCSIWYCIDY